MTVTEKSQDDLDPKFNKPFVEHLDDLRKTVFTSAILLVVGLLIAIPCAPFVLALAKVPMAKAGKDPEEFLQVIIKTISGFRGNPLSFSVSSSITVL